MRTDYRSPTPVALTFDDGPDPIWTPLVLDALASVEARATFFVVAPLAARYASLISSMRESGHDVAFHCAEHVRHDAMTRREIEADVESGLLALGRSVRYWRTPWGLITPATYEVAIKHRLVGWTADTEDWRGGAPDPAQTVDLEAILARISAGASARDAHPSFPEDPFVRLAPTGALAIPVPDPIGSQGRRASFAEEWRVLRAVAGADGSVGRILDGHFNGVERVSLLAPEPLRSRELEAITAGKLLLGVWGADPIPGEGEPARLVQDEGGARLIGVKTFCSGATGLDRALVLARGPIQRPPLLAYVDLSEGVKVDTAWFKAAGMRASESHRVVFEGAPLLAVLGEPGELLREPYFSRDAIRTAVTWAGISDTAVDVALDVLAAKAGDGEPDDVVSLAAGRMLAARGTIDRWLAYAADCADADPASLPGISTQLRESVSRSCREILDEAARAVGSHPFAVSGPLDRARRDLELFLLQHRLEPALVRRGRQAISDRRP